MPSVSSALCMPASACHHSCICYSAARGTTAQHCLPVQPDASDVKQSEPQEAERTRNLPSTERMQKKRQQEDERQEAERNARFSLVSDTVNWRCC